MHPARDYALIDQDDGSRLVRMPDGSVREVDFEVIHALAQDGSLTTEAEQWLARFVLGAVEDD